MQKKKKKKKIYPDGERDPDAEIIVIDNGTGILRKGGPPKNDIHVKSKYLKKDGTFKLGKLVPVSYEDEIRPEQLATLEWTINFGASSSLTWDGQQLHLVLSHGAGQDGELNTTTDGSMTSVDLTTNGTPQNLRYNADISQTKEFKVILG